MPVSPLIARGKLAWALVRNAALSHILSGRITADLHQGPFRGTGANMTILRTLTRFAIIAAVAAPLAACGINNAPTLEENAKAKWADVQNNYQRRADLIPNLVETVKGYAKQEQDTLTKVIEARAKATSVTVNAGTISDPAKFKEFQEAQNNLSGVLGRLLAIQEQYPDLKSNANFLALQSQLEGTENRITVARRDYNQAVQAYNTEVRTFPGWFWAKLFWGAKAMETFTASPGAQTAPQVKF